MQLYTFIYSLALSKYNIKIYYIILYHTSDQYGHHEKSSYWNLWLLLVDLVLWQIWAQLRHSWGLFWNSCDFRFLKKHFQDPGFICWKMLELNVQYTLKCNEGSSLQEKHLRSRKPKQSSPFALHLIGNLGETIEISFVIFLSSAVLFIHYQNNGGKSAEKLITKNFFPLKQQGSSSKL